MSTPETAADLVARVADVDTIRAHFPALERRHAGQPVAYFDAPGGTLVPRAVAEAASDYLLHHNTNSHCPFPTSAETDAVIAAGRAALADFLGGMPGEIAFGANMTSLTFHVARAIGRRLSCARGAPATRRPTRWTGWSRGFARSREGGLAAV